MRRLFALGLVSIVAVGGCIAFGDYGTDLTVPPSGGGSASAASAGSGGAGGDGGAGSGGGNSACLPSMQKAVEICNNGFDEGNDKVVCNLETDWTRRYGDGQNQSVLGLQIAPMGGVFFAGSMFGTVNIGDGKIVTNQVDPPKPIGYVAALSDNGSPLWIEVLDQKIDGQLAGLALGGSDVYAVGSMTGGAVSIVQKRLQSTGTASAAVSWGDPNSMLNVGVDVVFAPGSANSNNAYTASVYQGNGADPCPPLMAPPLDAPTPITVILKHDPTDLKCLASLVLPAPKVNGGQGKNQPSAIAVSSFPEIVIGGVYEGALGIPPGAETAASANPASYVIKTDTNLQVLWHKEFVATAGSIKIGDVAVSPSDNRIFVTGSLNGSIEPILGKTYTSDVADLFVMALNPANGDVVWFSLVSGPGVALGQSIVEYGGAIYVAGSTEGVMSVRVNAAGPDGSNSQICADKTKCMFLMKFDSGCGGAAWAMPLGADTTLPSEWKTAKLAASEKGLLLGLTWDEPMDFFDKSAVWPAPGGTDIVLAKYVTLP